MDNKQQQQKKKKASVMNAVWPVLLIAIFTEGMVNANSGGFIAVIAVLLIVGALGVLGWQIASKKLKLSASKKGSMYTVERFKEKSKKHFYEENRIKDPVRCTHSRGKQKYIEQAQEFYRCGLIDQNELKLLKARYEKLDIPEDFH